MYELEIKQAIVFALSYADIYSALSFVSVLGALISAAMLVIFLMAKYSTLEKSNLNDPNVETENTNVKITVN